MKIALCIICKGDSELESLKYAVASTKGLFDVFITANGESVSETRKWCKNNGYNFSYLPWNNSFSEQRNYNFAQAQGYDYILWMDSDDAILNPEVILEVARIAKSKDFDAVFFDYWYGNKFSGKPSLETFKKVEITQKRERLIKPGSIIWKKRLHESPLPMDGDKYSYSRVPYSEKYPVAWVHLGADRYDSNNRMQERMARNQELLELDLKDERETKEGADPRTILYLMKIYAESDDKETLNKCIKLGEEYLAKSGWDEERAVCYRLISVCFGKMNKHKEANLMLHEAIREYPHDPLLYLYLSRTYFNLKNYSAMKHWLDIALTIKDDRVSMANILDMEILSAQLTLQYYLYSDNKNAKKAYEAAVLLNKADPTPNNQANEERLYDLKEMDIASAGAHKYLLYLKSIERFDLIPKSIEAMPYEMQYLPFAQHFYNKYKEPKKWANNEICYYASFGGPHFEQWSPLSLIKGIGGSETAVIELAREWAKMGYKVTVYGDPGKMEGYHEGVYYAPWFKFNPRDHFNIFIQWRDSSLAGKIKCKKFMVDLHDLYWEGSHEGKPIDHIMVKSEFHKSLGPKLKNMEVVHNGIRE